MNSKEVWIIGVGPMAIEYAEVMKDSKINVKFIGRSKESAKIFCNF